MTIQIEIPPTVASLLATLYDPRLSPPGELMTNAERVKFVIEALIDHAQQGVYRPGAWEREWLIQAFGFEFTERLEPGDPYGREGGERRFQKPKE